MKYHHRKIKKWDAADFRLFFDDFYPSLCFFANKILQDGDIACDIVQEAFIYFWKKKEYIRSIPAAKSYLFKYVKNRSLNYLRDDHNNHEIEPEKLEAELFYNDFLIEDEIYRIINDAIESLPPRGKQVIEYTLDGLKNHEIAERLKISTNTVKTIKSRAYKTLRTELKEVYIDLSSS
jgi:RNA polymerase sigma-70 factor (family 1)